MSLFDMTGKVVVITGSSRGIGRAIAEEMAVHGAKVVISSRKQDACDAVAAEINDAFGEGRAIAIAASIKANGGALPEEFTISSIACVHRAFTKARTSEKGACRLLAQNIGIGLAPAVAGLFNNFGKAARNRTKEAMAIVDQFGGGKFLGAARILCLSGHGR
jgi:NAD(P)-dependent dehydrogenase (short-subunit alcohol dehydrogenase family)